MAVLGSAAIRQRISEIFVEGTYSADHIAEASYDLRVAEDGLLFGGRWHQVGTQTVDNIRIGAGEMAVLSTREQFTMPHDLVGIVNIKFKRTLQGLMLLFGSRVDPGYGHDIRSSPKDPYKGQRLYLLVYNAADREIHLRPGDRLFIVEFHTVQGAVTLSPRQNNDQYVALRFSQIGRFSFLAGVGDRVTNLESRVGTVETGLGSLERVNQYIVLGVGVLLATTLIGVVVGFIMAFFGGRPPGGTVFKEPPVSQVTLLRQLAFPQGHVISVSAEGVQIAPLSAGDIFQAGDIAVVIRKVSESEERYVGSIRLTKKSQALFLGRQIAVQEPIRVGDLVRISQERAVRP